MSYEEGTTIHRSTIELLDKLDKYLKQRDQYKAERDTLIDDLAVIRANSERYRKRAENAMDYAERSQCEVMRLEGENEKQLELLKDFSKFINYKLIVSPASDTYKHYRSELDKLGVK